MSSFAIKFGLTSVLAGVFSLSGFADTISLSQVYVSLGPVPGTTSYAAYTANAQAGVKAGGANTGGSLSTVPTAFNTVSTVTYSDFTASGAAKSWEGIATPTGAFSNEVGTTLFFSVDIKGAAGVNDLSLSQLSYVRSDTDTLVPNYFGLNGNFATIGTTYTGRSVGVFANGSTTTVGEDANDLVNELIITGVGVSFDASVYPGTGQAQLNAAIADAQTLGNIAIQTCFSIQSRSTCGSANVITSVLTPEPSSFGLLALGLFFAPFGIRRLRNR